MEPGNISVTEFIFAGLTEQPGLQLPLFLLFLRFFMMTVVGNLGLITLVALNTCLHTPRYFFLFNLSLIYFCFSVTIIPKMLQSFVSKKNIIQYSGCLIQLFVFCFIVNSESFILSVMTYDRYVAICKPLVYIPTTSLQVCMLLMLRAYFMGFSGALAHTLSIVSATFCANVINYFMCDIYPLLELSCYSTFVNELVVYVVVTIAISVPIIGIFISYTLALINIFHIPSTEGKSKAFITCSSNIIAVCLFFGSGAFIYLKPPSLFPLDQGKMSSLFYAIVVPTLNPLIYSLRNKDVKLALRKTLGMKIVS